MSEKAGSRSLVGQKSASGFGHEMDAASRSPGGAAAWELKHLTAPLEKNELLIFNGKGLDYFYGSSPLFARLPLQRFLLSGWEVRDEARGFAALWGIMVIEPGLLPLLYEAVARGFGSHLARPDRDAVRHEVRWACRPLQDVLKELGARTGTGDTPPRCGQEAGRYARAVLAVQEQIGADVTDRLAEDCQDWIRAAAHRRAGSTARTTSQGVHRAAAIATPLARADPGRSPGSREA